MGSEEKMAVIDTKKAREMRAKGTDGKWADELDEGRPDDIICDSQGNRLAVVRAAHHADDETNWNNARLIAYAVNNLTLMADEIDRLRDALREVTAELDEAHSAMNREDLFIGGTARAIAIVRARALLGGSDD
jgi:hypothetical protein